jgi:hypothetical protein
MFRNRLRGGDFGVEQDSRRSGGKRGGYIQLEAAEFGVIDEGGIRLAQVLAMVEGEAGKCAALGGDLLKSTKFTD